MGAFKVTRQQLVEVLGLTEGGLGGEESSLSSVNVRLEQIWRELLSGDHRNLICIHCDELQKLVEFSEAWKLNGKTLQTRAMVVNPAEPLSEEIVREINRSPAALAHMMSESGKLIFCHSPMLHLNRITKGQFEVRVWLHMITAPETP